MKKEGLKNLQKLLRQLRCLLSFGKWRDAQELRTLKLEELGKLEELAVRCLAVRALKKRHWLVCGLLWHSLLGLAS